MKNDGHHKTVTAVIIIIDEFTARESSVVTSESVPKQVLLCIHGSSYFST